MRIYLILNTSLSLANSHLVTLYIHFSGLFIMYNHCSTSEPTFLCIRENVAFIWSLTFGLWRTDCDMTYLYGYKKYSKRCGRNKLIPTSTHGRSACPFPFTHWGQSYRRWQNRIPE